MPVPDVMDERHIDDDLSHAGDAELGELVGVVGNIFGRFHRSPPSGLAAAVKHWRGLSVAEVVTVVQRFLDQHRDKFPGGSAERMLPPLEAELRKALAEKRPPAVVRKAVRSEPPPRRRVEIPTVGDAPPDVFVTGQGASEPQSSPAGRPGAQVGYEASGEPILKDDEAD
jgi:hypothetical protein